MKNRRFLIEDRARSNGSVKTYYDARRLLATTFLSVFIGVALAMTFMLSSPIHKRRPGNDELEARLISALSMPIKKDNSACKAPATGNELISGKPRKTGDARVLRSQCAELQKRGKDQID